MSYYAAESMSETPRNLWYRGRQPGWFVHVIRNGSDKADYWIVRVVEKPGETPDEVTILQKCGRRRKVPRNGGTIWKYRSEARADKKSRKWSQNKYRWDGE